MFETILVVDRHEVVRMLVVGVLESAHFRVLNTDTGEHAHDLARVTEGKIDLLLSDLDLADMTGPELGESLKKTRPKMHVMLMSGRQKGNLLVLNYGWAYIRTKLVPVKLVEMVKEVLNSPNISQPGGQQFDTRLRTDGKPALNTSEK